MFWDCPVGASRRGSRGESAFELHRWLASVCRPENYLVTQNRALVSIESTTGGTSCFVLMNPMSTTSVDGATAGI